MVERIRQISKLKQMIWRWRSLSRRRWPSRSSSGSGSSRSVRAGFVAVYVGADRLRFEIPTRFLNLPVFASLLERAEEEYGFQPAGGLALPCDPGFFGWLVEALDRDETRFARLGLDAFSELFAAVAMESSCRDEAACAAGSSPLLSLARI
ncbi:Small auxin-up RNA protein [Dioscorea alata]|uniref:Small auxin-up RNA protein n=1 Tax=Dioscorea alata TaxID=55571 RepID=A0ACB7WJ62_DIOAL|nr:Small auxin-up RNA protein [Dioscorea alata]